MATHHDDKPKSEDKVISIDPVVLTTVKIKTIEKKIISPKLIPVDVEKPVFVEKEYERPVPIDKEYERPICVDKQYERPIIEEVDCEKPIIKEVVCEKPILIEKEYEKPVIIEKEYPIPVPKEVPYDLPIMSMEKVQAVADEAMKTLAEAKKMGEDINEIAIKLDGLIDKIKERIPEEIKMPKITYEPVTVKDVKVVEEVVYVIGKIVAKDR